MATPSKCNHLYRTPLQQDQEILQQRFTNGFLYNKNNNHYYPFPPAEDQSQMMIERKRGLRRTQIDWLERSFQEDEGKPLEQEKKMKLSQELGLHPRQVSIWFQNRRARWKTKQLQELYNSLQEENQKLQYEVMKLRAKIEDLEMEKQAAVSNGGYKEAFVTEETGESRSSVINNLSSNNRIMLQDNDAHHKQLRFLAEDQWLHI